MARRARFKDMESKELKFTIPAYAIEVRDTILYWDVVTREKIGRSFFRENGGELGIWLDFGEEDRQIAIIWLNEYKMVHGVTTEVNIESLADRWNLVLEKFCSYLTEGFEELRNAPKLTPKERELAYYLSSGMSISDITLTTGKATMTIKNRIGALRRKLKVPSESNNYRDAREKLLQRLLFYGIITENDKLD